MAQRILVLQSVLDGATLHRKKRMDQSPFLQGYMFRHFYVLRNVRQPTLDQADLFERLATDIADFKPDIVIVHTGLAFRYFPKQIIATLRSIKTKFPNLRIAIQQHHSKLSERLSVQEIAHLEDIFDDSDEARDLINNIF